MARTAGAEVVGSAVQRLSRPNSAFYIGRGRAHELAALRAELDLDLLIVDDELSPAQQRNLEALTDTRVIDRTALILDIFAQHAHTREGQLQVELAQLEYRLPRLHRARQRPLARGRRLARLGGGGSAARSACAVPARRNWRSIAGAFARASRRCAVSLEGVRQQRAQQAAAARRAGHPDGGDCRLHQRGQVHALQRADSARVTAENKLFATLDPTTRQVTLPGGPAGPAERHRRLHPEAADDARRGLPRHAGGGGRGRRAAGSGGRDARERRRAEPDGQRRAR